MFYSKIRFFFRDFSHPSRILTVDAYRRPRGASHFRGRHWLTALLAGSALGFAAPSFAQFSVSGNVWEASSGPFVPTSPMTQLTAAPTVSPWSMAGDSLLVGYTANGTLGINAGGLITDAFGYIGYSASATGTATVSGTGAEWDSDFDLSVGYDGSGTLNIGSGGFVSNRNGYIGQNAGGVGLVTVNGPGAEWRNGIHMGSAYVGWYGKGTLETSNGGTVSTISASGLSIGTNAGSVGTATVSGAQSSWQIDGVVTVGWSGQGTLAITDGGVVNSDLINNSTHQNCYVGRSDGGVGKVTVSGAGSLWDMPGTLYVGGTNDPASTGGAGTLTLSDAGAVSAANVTIASVNGSAGTVNIGATTANSAAVPGVIEGVLDTVTSTFGPPPIVTFGPGSGNLVFKHTSGNYEFASVITGGGATTSAVDVYAGATVMAVASDYYGVTTAHGGVLAAGAANVFSAHSDYVAQDAGTLDLRGKNQTVASLANKTGGVVNMGANTTPGTVLTVAGNYAGNGGMIAINTTLGDESSPTDLLVVQGDTGPGTTYVKVRNATAGLGALTGGNGIRVVRVTGAGALSSGTFKLANAPLVDSGYEYKLVKVGTDWYLQSVRYVPSASSATAVPALDEAALGWLALLLAGGAAAGLRRKHRGSAA